MNFAVGFDLRLPQNLMEPMLRKLSAIRFVQVYIRTSNVRVSMVRNYYHFKDLEVVCSSNWLAWTDNLSFLSDFANKPCKRKWWGVWKSRKPESGIGTGIGTGSVTRTGNANETGTVMWRRTDTRTETSFTLYYFNSYSIYTKNNKTSLVSCSPLNLFILRQRESKKAESLISKAIALRVHRTFCQFLHRLCTTTTWNYQLFSSLEDVKARR